MDDLFVAALRKGGADRPVRKKKADP